MKYLEDNILSIKESIICHQVNCQGKMGAGLARSIKRKYKQVYKSYISAFKMGRLKLGTTLVVPVSKKLHVANLTAQFYYGRERIQYTDYNAFEKCLISLKDYVEENKIEDVYFPYKIGCGLAGSDWLTITMLIKKYFKDSIIVKYVKKGAL